MANNQLFSLLEKTKPEDIVFWTGAGISMQPPTALPSGAYLTELCMDAFMPRGTFDLVKGLFLLGKFKDSYGNSKTLPRLELIIEDIVGVQGFQAFEYFSFMNVPNRYLNSYHLFFAKHVDEGGTHFTMNLDNGIEASIPNATDKLINNPNQLTDKSNQLQSRLLKLHGTITDKPSYENLGVVLKNITTGINDILAQSTLNALIDSKILCFIGYGGVDSFDVTPFFDYFIGATSNKRLKDLTVIWLCYKKQNIFELCKPEEIGNGAPSILKGLKRAGAEIYAFKGNGIRLISFLENAWGWNLKKVRSKRQYDWKNIFDQELKNNPISDDIKNLIAGQYMAALGVGCWAVFFCNSSNTPIALSSLKDPQKGIFTSQTNQWWRVYTNGLRDLGKYKQATKRIRAWSQNVYSPFDTFVVLSRLMGECRIRGNFVMAFLIYRKAKKVLKKINVVHTANADELFALGEFWITYLHIHRDLWKRFPKVRKMLFYPWRYIVSKAWVMAFLLNRRRPSPHVSTQLYVLAKGIFGQSDYFVKQAKLREPSIPNEIEKCLEVTDITNFIETDSLLGDINYQRESIIDARNIHSVMIDEIRSNILKAETIQDWPGIWKAYYRLAKEYLVQQHFVMACKNAGIALDIMKKVEYSLYYRIDYTLRLWKILMRSKTSLFFERMKRKLHYSVG